MVRLTISETAEFLGKPVHWVYNTGGKVLKVFPLVSGEELAALIRLAFVSKSYAKYPYAELAKPTFIQATKKLHLSDARPKDSAMFYELVMAVRAADPSPLMSNVYSYMLRSIGHASWKSCFFKEYVYKRAAGKTLKMPGASGFKLLIDNFGRGWSSAVLRGEAKAGGEIINTLRSILEKIAIY